ncbi:MAG: DUF59 domain-containing protein [Candidatus Poseidoniales archaeon]|nr:MAG: DUF59 domain-containing protein [Candidatus Poseidoniales archaeon]
MGRKHVALQRRVARVLGSWKDPHDVRPYPELEIVQQVDIAEDGEVNLTVKPARPHCPCCLLDLDALRKRLTEVKGVTYVQVHVIDIPAAPRWTRAINR